MSAQLGAARFVFVSETYIFTASDEYMDSFPKQKFLNMILTSCYFSI